MGLRNGLGLGFKLLIAAIVVAGAAQLVTLGAGPSRAQGETVALDNAVPIAAAEEESTLEPMLAAATAIEPIDDENGFRVTHPLTVAGEDPLAHGEFVWDDEGVPAGRLRIVVDLEAETLYAYRGGYEIGRSVILYGTDDKPTPLGSFTITEMNEDHISNLYFVPMPYMMRLTNDGIAIHGNTVEQGYGSRGCVGVPLEFAALLFAAAELGTQVRIDWGPAADDSGYIAMTGIPITRSLPS